ncbi:MAG: peptidylprolyl isomerase [Oscillospiraceae bacterium]|nr:peptidylprolyl isomerase [Oscillospiraceae bacterium]
MKCKYCDAELVDGKPFCPSCGKENELPEAAPAEETPAVEAPVEETPAEETPILETAAEEKPAEVKEGVKMTPGKLALAIVAGVAVLAVLVALIISGINGGEDKALDATELPTDAASLEETLAEETVPATIPADGNPDDVTCKGSYTVTDEEVAAAADTVVATMGDKQLTNAQLQVFYWMEVMNFLNSYGDYAIYFGMDYTQPLDTQLCEDGSENPTTWQQYFLACALDSWKSYQSLCIEAEETGFVLSEEYATYLEELPAQLETNAASAGMASALELVQANVGAGADVEDYIHYIELYYRGYNYFNELYSAIIPTEAEINAYFAENEASYTESGVTKDGGDQMDVRHILVTVQGGTTDDEGNTTYSDAEWETCRAAAQEILDQWLAGEATEDSFAALANEKSEDSGSNTNGGLYTGLTADTNFVENFKNWYLEAGRKAGDYGLVQTEYGYHIMYFSGSEPIWYATAEADLTDERATAILPECIEKHPATIDYSAIQLGLVDLVGEE